MQPHMHTPLRNKILITHKYMTVLRHSILHSLTIWDKLPLNEPTLASASVTITIFFTAGESPCKTCKNKNSNVAFSQFLGIYFLQDSENFSNTFTSQVSNKRYCKYKSI